MAGPALIPAGDFRTSYAADTTIFPTRGSLVACLAGVVLLALAPTVLDRYALSLLILIGINGIAALGLNLLTGCTGQISLGHAAFFGLGAFGSTYLNNRWGVPVPLAIPMAGLIATVVGMVVGLPAARIKGLELEVDAIPWANGRISGFAAWLDSEIVDGGTFEDGYACAEREIYGQPLCGDPRVADIRGNQLPFAPEYSLTANLEQRFDLASSYALTPRIGVHWQSKMWFDILNYDGAHLSQAQDAYTKVDLGLRLDSPIVSRAHARFTRTSGVLTVEDLDHRRQWRVCSIAGEAMHGETGAVA